MLCALIALAWNAAPLPCASEDLAATQTPAPAEAGPKWDVGLSAYYLDPPHDDARVTTILTADRDRVHLEGRYGYEDLDTASAFAGYRFDVGDETAEDGVHAGITPMAGVVFGDTEGFAPALLLDVGWRKLELYSESEYLIDSGGGEDFFYSWSTLLWRFGDAFAAGIVAERTKLVDTDFELNRGLALEVSPGPVHLAFYAYNLGAELAR
jgi:hypothetical protein